MAACPSSETGPGGMCPRIPVPPKAEHAGDLSSYPTTVFLPDGDDYCSPSRTTPTDDVVDTTGQLSRSVPAANGSCWIRPSSLIPPEDRCKGVNAPPNKNPFSSSCPPSRSRQRLPTHTGVSGMSRPAAPVAVRHDSWSHSPPTTADQKGVSRTLTDWRPENLATLPARPSPSTRSGHHGQGGGGGGGGRGAAAHYQRAHHHHHHQPSDCKERCSTADCPNCSSAPADRR